MPPGVIFNDQFFYHLSKFAFSRFSTSAICNYVVVPKEKTAHVTCHAKSQCTHRKEADMKNTNATTPTRAIKNIQEPAAMNQADSHANSQKNKQQPDQLKPTATQGFLRKKEVLRLTGWSSSTLYNRISENAFRHPVRTGPRSVAWPAHEVYEFMARCIAERDQRDARSQDRNS